MATAFIGLGSNLEQPAQQITQALNQIADIQDTQLIAWSHLFETPALPPKDNSGRYFDKQQPNYLNACAKVSTTLTPFALLQQLQDIETTAGKTRQALEWAPRVLDLDLLLFDQQCIHTVSLILPHPEMTVRDFVLMPLLQLEPTLKMPDGTGLKFHLEQLNKTRPSAIKTLYKPELNLK